MNNVINKLNTHHKFGIKLGLENIKKVLNKLNNPQNNYQIIHIGGTNGKGSTCAILNKCLLAAGYKVGLYTSPSLMEITDMFVINEKQITLDQLDKYYECVNIAAKILDINLTLYEVTTSIMFLYANDCNVDYLILEVGLGGQFDATNIVTPKLSAITNVNIDHTNILGDTLLEIASEKAGIIKENIPFFTSESNLEIISVFNSISNNIHLVEMPQEYKLNSNQFTTSITTNNTNFELSLYGEHQVTNFMLAKKILNFLNIDDDIIKTSVQNVKHIGRIEKISSNIIFDGAHNPAAATSLVNSLANNFTNINIIFSILNDKEVKEVVEILQTLSTNITFIPLTNIIRGMNINDFKQYQFKNIKISSRLEEAVDEERLNLVCGTFYLYPLLIEYIKNRKE